jgi:hypothetical protein
MRKARQGAAVILRIAEKKSSERNQSGDAVFPSFPGKTWE